MARLNPAVHAVTPAASLLGRPAAEHAPSAGRSDTAQAARRWRSAELFGTGQEIEIEHGQAVYRLRLTSLGKLILTK